MRLIFFLMLMIIVKNILANLLCHKAPGFVLEQTLPRYRQRFISEHIIGQVPQSDLAPCSNDADAAQDQIPRHHGLDPKDMLNPTACLRPSVIATLFPLCQFFMSASFPLKVFTKALFAKHFQSVFGTVCRIGIYIAACIGTIQQFFKFLASWVAASVTA